MGTVWRLRFKRKRKLQGKPPGVQWWRASSTLTSKALHRAFGEERVGRLLYETVCDVRSTQDSLWHKKVILVKLVIPVHPVDVQNVEMCLRELGVHLINPVNNGEDTHG